VSVTNNFVNMAAYMQKELNRGKQFMNVEHLEAGSNYNTLEILKQIYVILTCNKGAKEKS
jgi:hypothetical protein